jgi:Gp49-like protein DUF891
VDKRWRAEWLVVTAGGKRKIPAFEFLKALDDGPRGQLLAIVDAVRSTGPDQWKDHRSHAPMKGAIADLHEARDKHGGTLYRLFLLWLRESHCVVYVDGRTKTNKTVLADAEYAEIQRLADLVKQDDPPFATADDFARRDLE